MNLTELDSRDFFNASMVKYDGEEPSTAQFTVSITNWTHSNLTLKVKFMKPHHISSGKLNDLFQLEVIPDARHFFVSKYSGNIMVNSSLTTYEIPSQLPYGVTATDLVATADQVSTTTMAVTGVQVVL
jgi:hypothetical protein